MRTRKGFALLEIILSLAIIAALASISLPLYVSFQARNDLDIAQTALVHNIRRAQILAEGSDGDMSWGVRAQNGNIILFKGISYAARDTSFDETFAISPSISLSGISDIVFAKTTGLPQSPDSLTLTFSPHGSKTITVNKKGMVAYE